MLEGVICPQSEEMAHVPASLEPGERRLEKDRWMEEQRRSSVTMSKDKGYAWGGGGGRSLGKTEKPNGEKDIALSGRRAMHKEEVDQPACRECPTQKERWH